MNYFLAALDDVNLLNSGNKNVLIATTIYKSKYNDKTFDTEIHITRNIRENLQMVR